MVVSCSSTKNTTTKPANQKDFEINSLMIDAVTALNTNDFTKAENLYQQILQQDKNNAAAMYYLSSLYFQRGDIEKSLDYSKRCVKANQSNVWYKLHQIDIYLSLQQYEDASKVMEIVIKQKPEVLEYWQQLANLYHVCGNTKAEIETLNRLEERFGVNDWSSMLKYNLYKEKNDTKKAEEQIINLTKAFPSQSKYWSILAEMKMQEKNYDKALEYYKKVEQMDPNNELLNLTFANYYLVKNNQDSLFHYLYKAAAQEDVDFQTKTGIIFTVYQDKVDTDVETFNRFFTLLERMKLTSDSTHCELWSMLNLGYMRKNDFINGAYSAQKALDLGCNNFDLHVNLLYAASTFDSAEKLVEISDKAIESYPEQPLPYLFKGVNLVALEKWNEAIESLEIGLKRTGNDKDMKEDFYINLGDCYHAINDNEQCFKNYDKALEINPDNYFVLNNYAYYLSLDNKDLDKALQYAKKVVDKYPEEPTFVDTYAWVLYQMKRYNEAKSAFDSILSIRNSWGATLEEHYKIISNKAK